MKRVMSLLIIVGLLLCFTNVGLAASNNNSFETAKRLTVGESLVGTLSTTAEEDYFYVTVPAGVKTMAFHLQNVPSDSDFGMTIYDENLNEVITPVRQGKEQEAVLMTVKPNEKYYIRVLSIYGTGGYTVVTRQNKSIEPNDTLKPTTIGASSLFYICDTLSDDDTSDWYRILIPAGSHQLYLQGIPAGSDYDLNVYDFTGMNLIASSLNNDDANESVELEGGKTYAVHVSLCTGGNSQERYILFVE